MSDFDQFLPLGPGFKPSTPSKPPAKASAKSAKPADPESDPSRQLARRLGTYGAAILRDKIKVEYLNQRAVWNKHISKIATAFSVALAQQAETLKKDEQDRRASAELCVFVFSLVSGVVMRWAGTYVQYKLYPSLASSLKTKTLTFNDTNWPDMIVPGAVKISEMDYDKALASFFGGTLQDFGNRISSFTSRPGGHSPYAGLADDDPRTLVRIVEQSLKDAVDDGTQAVADQMDEAVFWMEQSPDFGAAWSALTNGQETPARDLIRQQFQDVRDRWAKAWPYFGQNPKPFDQSILAQEFERALWAGFFEGYFSQAAKKAGFTFDQVMNKTIDNTLKRQRYSSILLDEAPPEMTSVIHSMDVGYQITNKLRTLNVLLAKSAPEIANQQLRTATGEAPKPAGDVGYQTASFDEVRTLWGWARGYPAQAAEVVKKKSAEGTPRTLAAIPKY